MTDREVWLRAGEIVEEHGDFAARYIVMRASEMVNDPTALHDLLRLAAAVDEIAGGPETPRH